MPPEMSPSYEQARGKPAHQIQALRIPPNIQVLGGTAHRRLAIQAKIQLGEPMPALFLRIDLSRHHPQRHRAQNQHHRASPAFDLVIHPH